MAEPPLHLAQEEAREPCSMQCMGNVSRKSMKAEREDQIGPLARSIDPRR